MNFALIEKELNQEILSESENLIRNLASRDLMIATAESCTGGMIFSALTDISGASRVADCGFITYTNAAKTELLGVNASIIAINGAVSAAVAGAMAQGALQRAPQARIAVSVTGVAGPGGGSPEKPVGTVFFGFAFRYKEGYVKIFTEKQEFYSQFQEKSVKEQPNFDIRRFVRLSSVRFALKKINQTFGTIFNE